VRRTIPLVALEAIPCRDQLAALQAALHEIYIPGLVQRAMSRALENYSAAAKRLESGLDVNQCIRLGRIRFDTGLCESAVRVQRLEEHEGSIEVVNYF
jgi:hypothetical protein